MIGNARWCLALLLVGCAARFVTVQRSVSTPGAVQVDVESTGSGSFSLRVTNLLQKPLSVNRDAVALITPKGARKRLPGGLASMYLVAPSGIQLVNVHYETRDLRDGEKVALGFENVFSVDGATIAVPQLPFLVQE
jgi:hypothetical protein